MKKFCILLIVLITTGCSVLVNENENVKWFKDVDKAINYGLKEENVHKKDVIGKVKDNGELFIFYKKQLKNGIGLGVSNISKRNGKYTWYRANPDVLVNVSKISWETKTLSNKKFVIFTGVTKDKNIAIETKKGMVNPKIDSNNGIYYYVESIEK
ncbi:hypothetical protein [Neobacillus sp. LXY-1]|uniref:hypothetical protein n=1 Tax=Neobacillus sp. LXY-1 TaxID=3379133 RepID=UPI003EE29601